MEIFEWFKSLDPAVQAAVITSVGAILCAIIAGVFGIKKKNSLNSTNIKQKQKGKNNTQIGVQNNYKEADSN